MDYNYLRPHILSLIFPFILLSFIYLLFSRKPKNLLPPGPYPLPLIGNLHLVDGAKPHQSLAKLSENYGPIMCLKLGQITTIIISSPSMAKEVLQKQDLAFSNRYVINAGEALNHHQYSVIWLPISPRWRLHRKILSSNLFSSTKLDSTEHFRSKKVEELIEHCKRKSEAGEPVNIGAAVLTTILNLLSNMIFSKDLSDPFNLESSSDKFKNLIHDVLEMTGKNNMVDLFPMLQKFDPQGIRRQMEYLLGNCCEVFCRLIDERLEQRKLQPSIVFNDVLGNLLSTSDQEEDLEEFDREHIWHLFVDLFVAGFDSISNTIEWAMAELLQNPETMKKTKDELTKKVKKGKQLKEVDVAHLPYLSCVLKETIRLHPATALLLPRKVEKTIEICGFTIPKNSQILVNVWAVARDPNIWEQGSKFQPDFFLKSEIDFRGQNFELIPFGAGRRICPGLPLAMRMLPCILGSLLNVFEWKLDDNVAPHELDMEEGFGLTLNKAHPLKVIPFPL